jgi:hypothetical protein
MSEIAVLQSECAGRTRESRKPLMNKLFLANLVIATAACVRMAPVENTPYDDWVNDLNKRLWWEFDGDLKPLGALKHALEESRKLRFISEVPTAPWKTPKEVEEAGGSDGKNLAIWTINRAWGLAPGMTIKLVVGKMKFRGGHAWVEVLVGDQAWWADPSVQQGKRFGPASSFYDRVPVFAYEYDGLTFGKKSAFF